MNDITPEQLRTWRIAADMTQERLGVQLGLKKVAITKIESGNRQISGPEQKLLKLLLYGEIPFSTAEIDANSSQLRLTLDQWKVIRNTAQKEGYDDTTLWIVDKIKGYLRMNPETAQTQMAAESAGPYHPQIKDEEGNPLP